MRNLIITREKAFSASLLSMKVYIEDHVTGDTTIDGVLCRKLGNLKNGEQKTFEIDDTAARIYVIQDKLSKGFCNEFFDIPQGTFDVALKGKNHYNPLAGNPFRFEGTANEEVVKNRKKTFKKSLIVMVIALIIGFVLGFVPTFFGSSGEPETFSSDEISITLTDEFISVPEEDFYACYGDGETSVFIIKEDFSLFPEDLTLEEYGKLLLSDSPDIEFTEYEGLYCTEYTAMSEDGTTEFAYFVAIYETDDAFWCVNFAIESEKYLDIFDQYVSWAKNVTFE